MKEREGEKENQRGEETVRKGGRKKEKQTKHLDHLYGEKKTEEKANKKRAT